MQRPVIIVDLDNVVYDFVKAMAHWLYANKVIPSWSMAMVAYSQWSIWDDWNVTKGEFMRWWRLGIEAGEIYGRGDLIVGARDALWRLSDAEWHIHIVTNRLTKFGLHDQIVANTCEWLRSNNIPYRDLSFLSDKQQLRADAAVDDREDNLSETHGRTFLFGAAHNGSTLTWRDVLKELL